MQRQRTVGGLSSQKASALRGGTGVRSGLTLDQCWSIALRAQRSQLPRPGVVNREENGI